MRFLRLLPLALLLVLLLPTASEARTWTDDPARFSGTLQVDTKTTVGSTPAPGYGTITIRDVNNDGDYDDTNDGLWIVCSDGTSYGPFIISSSAALSSEPFITKTATSGLSDEFALGSLATGLLVNTTTTGVPVIATIGTTGIDLNTTTLDFDPSEVGSVSWGTAPTWTWPTSLTMSTPLLYFGDTDGGLFDDTNNVLCIGNTSGTNTFVQNGATYYPQLQAHANSTAANLYSFLAKQGSATASHGALIALARSQGTVASPTVVVSGDTLGGLYFDGYDGTDFAHAATILAKSDGTPGSNDMPGRLEFYITADNTQTLGLALTIDSTGQISDTDAIGGDYKLDLTNSSNTNGSKAISGSATGTGTGLTGIRGYVGTDAGAGSSAVVGTAESSSNAVVFGGNFSEGSTSRDAYSMYAAEESFLGTFFDLTAGSAPAASSGKGTGYFATEGVHKLGNISQSSYMVPPGYSLDATPSGTAIFVAGEAYFCYVGKAPARFTSCDVRCYVETAYIAGGGGAYAKVSILTGSFVNGGVPTLTARGTTDVAASFGTTGSKKVTVGSLTGINPGDDIWVGFSVNTAGVPFQLYGAVKDPLGSGVFQKYTGDASAMSATATTAVYDTNRYGPFCGLTVAW